MIIRILHQYHNNMYDMVQALKPIARVEFLSYRTSKLPLDITNRQPRTIGRRHWAYHPNQLAHMLGSDTDILILKHLHHPINLVPYLLCWRRRIPCLVTTQQPTPRWFSFIAPAIRRLPLTVIATTKTSHQFAQRLGFPSYYIPACINPERFTPPVNLPGQGNQLRLLAVAKYQPRKQLPQLIEAVAYLRQRYPQTNFRLTIIGALTDNPERQREFNHLKELIHTNHLSSAVKLLADLPYHEMYQRYRQAHLFILPAASEPLGYAVLEAMATGLPVIVSAAVGAASYITPQYNGHIIPNHNPTAIATAIATFLTAAGQPDWQTIRTYGARAHQTMLKQHSPVIFRQRFQAVLADLL